MNYKIELDLNKEQLNMFLQGMANMPVGVFAEQYKSILEQAQEQNLAAHKHNERLGVTASVSKIKTASKEVMKDTELKAFESSLKKIEKHLTKDKDG